MLGYLKSLIFGPELFERDDVERTPAQRAHRAFQLHFSANSVNVPMFRFLERIDFDRTGMHVWAEILREWRPETNALDTIELPIGRGSIEAVRFLKPWDHECDEELQILAQVSRGLFRRRVFTMKVADCSDEMRATLVDFVAFIITMEDLDDVRQELGESYLTLLRGPIDSTLEGWQKVAADWWEEQGRPEVTNVLLGRLPAWNEPPFTRPVEDEP